MGDMVLGIDYGSNNIGLAFGKGEVVAPLTVISGKNDNTAIKEIARYTAENKVRKLVMGLPLTAEGKDTPQARKIRKFGKLLKIKLKLPLEYVNEFATTKESVLMSIQTGMSQKDRRIVDHLSAALILKRYNENSD